MLPTNWGRKAWFLLHIITVFPKRKQEIYQEFFSYLQYLLPCEKCRHSYKEHIHAIIFPKKKQGNAIWLIRVHNRVNRTIDKPILDEIEMLFHWEKEYVSTNTILDTGLIETFSYFLEDHPGSRKIDTETVTAHKFFWDHITKLLPSKIQDLSILNTFLEEHPLDKEIIQSKTKYRKWFEKLQKRFHQEIPISTKECVTYCKI